VPEFKDDELNALLDEYSCRTLQEFEDFLNVNLSTVSKRLM